MPGATKHPSRCSGPGLNKDLQTEHVFVFSKCDFVYDQY